MKATVRRIVLLMTLSLLLTATTGTSQARAQTDEPELAPQVTEDIRVATDDGVELLVKLGGRGPLVDGHLPPRPVIAEFSPYGQDCCAEYGGPEFNYLQVHIRGTGDSNGAFDALGPRSQQDMADVLGWACTQPWSSGRIGLWGFSASAIMSYNSLHLDLPCLETAVLGSGTHELYRDLLYPGGIPNAVPAAGVYGLIGAPAFSLMPDRLGRDPLSLVDLADGFANTFVDYATRPTLDGWWLERGMRGDVNKVPTLMIDGFFDVESRGAFQAFQELRDNGSHLYVVGAHDGIPEGSGGADDVTRRWFERHLLGIENGVDDEPVVQLWMANGDRADMLAGDFVTTNGTDWPIPGTTWTDLYLSAEPSGTANSLNDGTLSLEPGGEPTQQAYVPINSLPTATDVHTTALIGMFNGSDELTLMDGPERLGLSYTTEPFGSDVRSAGPASLELQVTTLMPETDLYAVISDVRPDGSAHPMGVGRLRTAFPEIIPERSLTDENGTIVQPYNDFSAKHTHLPGTEKRYFVEFWPIGNQFKAGHRLRLHVVGASAFYGTIPVGANLVQVGGPDGSVLRFPVLPGSDLGAAISDPANGSGNGSENGSGGEGDSGGPAPTSAISAGDGTGELPRTGEDSLAPWAAGMALLGFGVLAAFRRSDAGAASRPVNSRRAAQPTGS